jgi:hypothetical protein
VTSAVSAVFTAMLPQPMHLTHWRTSWTNATTLSAGPHFVMEGRLNDSDWVELWSDGGWGPQCGNDQRVMTKNKSHQWKGHVWDGLR